MTKTPQDNALLRRELYTPAQLEVRQADGQPTREITGYAVVFGQQSLPLYRDDTTTVREVIAPEAITRELLDSSDIVLTMFHDNTLILARSRGGAGTLRYDITERGVRFSAEMPRTADGDKALELVSRGELAGCSFAFTTQYGDRDHVAVSETRDEEGHREVLCTVRRMTGIYDFTIAARPAYPGTSVDLRDIVAADIVAADTASAEAAVEAAEDGAPAEELPSVEVPAEGASRRELLDALDTLRDRAMDTAAGTPLRRALDSAIEGLTARMAQTENATHNTQNPNQMHILDQLLRDNVTSQRVTTFQLRAVQTTASLADTGIIPVQEQEMLKPLREGLIYDKVGLNIRTGHVGTLRWPAHSKVVASYADEAEAATDSNIDFSALSMSGERLVVATPVTKETLFDSEGVVESVIREELPKGIIDRINETLFSIEGKDAAGKNKKVVGPFVAAAKADRLVTFAGELPTRRELLKMKAKVASAGIPFVAPCWVMNENMKAELEDLKVDAGSGRFVCESDHILGYPVFTTHVLPDGYVGFGDWSYQAAGFFGPMDLVVDPYTLARKHSVDFVLNTRFGTVTLRPDAFVLGKVTPEEEEEETPPANPT